MQALLSTQITFYSQVINLLTLILVNPATNAASEHSFSAMRRIKTYLRSTMSQSRLNAVMVLHVHKDKTEKFNLVDVANSFVNAEHRNTILEHFLYLILVHDLYFVILPY